MALEYLKSLKILKSSLTPVTIHRKIAPYHDKKLHSQISSATAIRECILKSTILDPLTDAVPKETFTFLSKIQDKGHLPDFDELTPYIHGALLSNPHPATILDWNTDLANKIESISWASMTYMDIIENLKSRNITQTRLQRALLHLVLGIEQEQFFHQYNQNPVPYTRILGFRKESRPLLKAIKENSEIPVITKPASITKMIAKEDEWVWQMDLKASRLYQSIFSCHYKEALPSAYTRSPIII